MADRHAPSLRRRLLALLLVATALTWLGTMWFSYRDTRHELDELLDAHLAQSATLLIAQVGHEADDIDTEHMPALHRYTRDVAFQVWEQGRKLVLRSASAPEAPLSSHRDGFSDSEVTGDHWRVFSTWDAAHHYLVQVGERRAARDELAETIAENLLRPLMVTLPVLALLIWSGIGAALRPLQSLRRQVAERRADNLTALETGAVPAEVVPLVEALNRLFMRVRESFEKEKRFTADAAHELRTPLAAIKTQAQVARAATADIDRLHALDNVLVGCDRATHLVEQLLTLARLEPERMNQRKPEEFRALAAGVVAELAPDALAKNVDLQLQDGERVSAPCLPGLVTILMRNLVDNAVRYSPRRGTVRISVMPGADGVEFAVVDEGPGIPPEEQALVWDRFYRVLGTGETGSGLGLSIVRRIADLHGARTTLGAGDGGQGLRVTVTFPSR